MNITAYNKRNCALCLLSHLTKDVLPPVEHMSGSRAASKVLFDHVRRTLEAHRQSHFSIPIHSPDSIAGTWASCRTLPGSVLNELQRQGVDQTTLKKALVRRAKIVWCGPDRFEFAASGRSPWMYEGEQANIFLVRDAFGRALDIVAWDPKTNRLGSWLAVAFALGQGTAFAPRLSDGLLVHRTVPNWLHAGGKGVVIVDTHKARSYLNDAGRLIAEDAKHRRELQAALSQPLPRILIASAAKTSKEG
jgi:hypothetical protein